MPVVNTPLIENRTGVLYDLNGDRLPETPVRLITIDNQGNETAQLATTVSDASGQFTFDLPNYTDASTVIEASVNSTSLRGFWAGSQTEIPLHPITQAVYQIVLDLLSSGELSFSDLPALELRLITQLAFNLDTGLDVSDLDALETSFRTNLGRSFAQLSGGEICLFDTSSLETTETVADIDFAPNTAACPIGYDVHILSGETFQFDLRPDGSICGGTGGTLPAMLAPNSIQLGLPGEVFVDFGSNFPDGGIYTFEGDREVAYGPYTLQAPVENEGDPITQDTLQVSRKVFVPETGNYARFLEIFENTGETDRVVSLKITSSLLTGSSSETLTHDTSLSTPGISDRFLAAYDASGTRPTTGFIFQDGLGTSSLSLLYAPGIVGGADSEVQFRWINATIPAGTTKTWVHYVFMSASQVANDVRSSLLTATEQPDMTGMSLEELAGLMNFAPSRGTVVGGAGSVVGLSEVTATQLDENGEATTETLAVTAHRDGSFAIPLNIETGDTVHITSSDGLDTTLTLPESGS